MSIAAAWPADVRDACGNFFGTALRACDPLIAPNARVLEIGCAEWSWLGHARQSWPLMTLTGIDWRPAAAPEGTTVIRGDVLQQDFGAGSLDWIVGVSSIEHIGLGHYDRDPVDRDGDVKAVADGYRWLSPGGWLYLDVPYNPTGYAVAGTSHRVYDDRALRERFGVGPGGPWAVIWRGVVRANATHTLLPEPVEPLRADQFYYIGLWLRKL